MCDFQAARWTLAKDVPGQAGNNHPTGIPTGVFKTSDGYINIAASGDHIYKRFCESIKAPELLTDERFSSRQGPGQAPRRAECGDRQADVPRFTSAEAGREAQQGRRAGRADLQDGRDVRRSAGQAPQDGASDQAPKLGDQEVIGQAINMSRTPVEDWTATPEQGEHTESVLKEVGYDAAAIEGFRKRGVICSLL